MRQTSLQHKVLFGYYLISALALGLGLFTLVELRVVSARLVRGDQVFLMLNDVLEMRRFEKNFFLYHQQEDMDQLLGYLERVEGNPNLDGLPAGAVGRYRELVAAEVDGEAEKKIRALGKAIVTAAEGVAETERIEARRALERHRLMLLMAMIAAVVVILLLGRTVARRIVLPLRRLEESMAGVVDGRYESLRIQDDAREILSLTQAFNLVLRELRERQRNLVRSEKLAALGTLLAGVAHELNNPLSNISTSCQILLEEGEETDPAFAREMLEQIDDQTRRARDIVRSLLDFARDRPFRAQEVHLAPLIDEVIRFSKGHIPPRIRVRVEVDRELVLSGDRQRLQQAFLNLLKNAVDAIPEHGEVLIRAMPPNTAVASGIVGSRCRAPWTEILVQDTGLGIAGEHLARIFDPFFTTKPVGKGSGLGLSVVHEVIEEHGGEIAVESRLNRGTRFIIRLPVRENG
ncbi:MAG: HAMP domain-containing protein [Magnetococcales bacterium]|nr:HAMP domain-containing protein [Magnetococcales bacterium]